MLSRSLSFAKVVKIVYAYLKERSNIPLYVRSARQLYSTKRFITSANIIDILRIRCPLAIHCCPIATRKVSDCYQSDTFLWFFYFTALAFRATRGESCPVAWKTSCITDCVTRTHKWTRCSHYYNRGGQYEALSLSKSQV